MPARLHRTRCIRWRHRHDGIDSDLPASQEFDYYIGNRRNYGLIAPGLQTVDQLAHLRPLGIEQITVERIVPKNVLLMVCKSKAYPSSHTPRNLIGLILTAIMPSEGRVLLRGTNSHKVLSNLSRSQKSYAV